MYNTLCIKNSSSCYKTDIRRDKDIPVHFLLDVAYIKLMSKAPKKLHYLIFLLTMEEKTSQLSGEEKVKRDFYS